MTLKLKLKKNKALKKANYVTKDEYKFDKNTDVIPSKNNRLLCIMFSEDKGCHFLYRKMNRKNAEYDFFRFRKGKYIIDNESIHITSNGARIAFYLEGISTPIKMSNIEHEIQLVKYNDLEGKQITTKIRKIKGLKFDARILDTFTDRTLSELFTKQTIDNFQLIILILSICIMIISVIGIVISYFYR